MKKIQTFQVYPKVPQPLTFIETLTQNLWWSWNLDAIELFRRVSPGLWNESGRNPIVFSTMQSQKRLEELSKDESFLAHMKQVEEEFEHHVICKRDYSVTPFGKAGKVAYLSMEFGIHESLPLFAGGLGILAGDHLKAASDLDIPLVGIGLMYRSGYFHQFLDKDGWQQENYPETNLFHLPITRAKTPNGENILITVKGPTGNINAIVWEVQVGRIPLYLLDTNHSSNPPEIRDITARLYASEGHTRLSQELLLGIGGIRVLDALGIKSVICHMNEGHCTFASLERLHMLMKEEQIDLETASEIIRRTNVFTTHTPVAAGHDEFPANLVRGCLEEYQAKFNLSMQDILRWGQHEDNNPEGNFSMCILGLTFSQYCNGVSELHGHVARQMWCHLWPSLPVDEVPISHVTNGVHIPSWISIENSLLFERYLGPEWYLRMRDMNTVQRIDNIYDEELWRARELSRSRLISHCRKLMQKQYARRNAPKSLMKEVESVLDQDVLTIAFARRFATYKRATLLLHDPDRFIEILRSKDRPIQFIFAGKAHPKDNEGKAFIQNLVQFARHADVRHRLVFLEDYDIQVARYLVQGADVWLNNPRRPYEACGTSGMKAAVNGILNLSILDGWWCEGFNSDRGWAFGGDDYTDIDYQDSVESQALYNILENEVIPCFYNRENNFPIKWIKMMKESMKMAMSEFSSCRMVMEYYDRFYKNAAERRLELLSDHARESRELKEKRYRFVNYWKDVRLSNPERSDDGPFRVGENFTVKTKVFLGNLTPDDVEVELYFGDVQSNDKILNSQYESMNVSETLENGEYIYSCNVNCQTPGRFGFTARALPKGDNLIRYTPHLITWG